MAVAARGRIRRRRRRGKSVGAPELYLELIALNAVPSLVNLLGHDNADIRVDVVSLLGDHDDVDVLGDHDDPAHALVAALVDNNALERLIQNLARLSEAAAIYNTLATVENMIEVNPAVTDLVYERTKLMRWLLGQVKVREFDANKQYASEILAILLQNSATNQKRLGQMNGVDGILQAVAMYKSRDPKSSDEKEMLENLFDCLCCLLIPAENKERFFSLAGDEEEERRRGRGRGRGREFAAAAATSPPRRRRRREKKKRKKDKSVNSHYN